MVGGGRLATQSGGRWEVGSPKQVGDGRLRPRSLPLASCTIIYHLASCRCISGGQLCITIFDG